MKIVVLNILASDILETEYTNSVDCAITRALDRAGYPEYADAGTRIEYKDSPAEVRTIREEHEALARKVLAMYTQKRIDRGTIRRDKNWVAVPIEDFSYSLTFLDLE